MEWISSIKVCAKFSEQKSESNVRLYRERSKRDSQDFCCSSLSVDLLFLCICPVFWRLRRFGSLISQRCRWELETVQTQISGLTQQTLLCSCVGVWLLCDKQMEMCELDRRNNQWISRSSVRAEALNTHSFWHLQRVSCNCGPCQRT